MKVCVSCLHTPKKKVDRIILIFYLLEVMLVYLAIHGGSCSTWFLNSPYQLTPLHMAAHAGHVDTVRCLVDKGADTNIKNRRGVSE